MRNTWPVEVKTGGSWISDGNIYRPNTNFVFRKISTQTMVRLADGDEAFMTPATKYSDNLLTFLWYYDTGTTKTKVEGYINAQSDLKITDHNSEEYIGRFINLESTWIVGRDSDRYNIRAGFQRMSSLA